MQLLKFIKFFMKFLFVARFPVSECKAIVIFILLGSSDIAFFKTRISSAYFPCCP